MIKLVKSTFYRERETKKKLIQFIRSKNYNRYLSFGEECIKFENNFANYQGRKYCIFFSSGSAANLALIQALLNIGRISKGDKVAFSRATWSTNVMPLIQLGLTPIPIDIEIDTLNVSSQKFLESPISTKLFFITNLLGFCDDIDEIAKLCKEKNIILIEDTCESLGTIYKKKKLGNFGEASTFSFYVGHHMSTIEGGAVCTDNRELSTMLKIVRAHGWDRNLEKRSKSQMRKKYNFDQFYSKYTFYDLGFNFRPTEINGFLGNDQLNYIEEINNIRNKNFLLFAKAIYGHTDSFLPLRYEHIDFISNFAFPVICKSIEIRNKLIQKCEGLIEIRPIVGGDIMSQPFYNKYFKNQVLNKSNAHFIHNNGFYIGNNPELTKVELNHIIKVLTT